MNPKGTNGVKLPDVGTPDDWKTSSSIIENLYRIEYVAISAVFDDEAEPLRELKNPRSSRLFELLNAANLHRGTVISLAIQPDGKKLQPISPAALARLNWFLHTPGYSKGFRGWRRQLEREHAGASLWKSAEAWAELKRICRL